MRWEDESIVGVKPPPEQKSRWENESTVVNVNPEITKYGEGFAGGFNLGLTEMAGMPVDITNAILEQASKFRAELGLEVGPSAEEKPVGGSQWLRKQVEKTEPVMGEMYSEGPDTTLGRVAHRVGEELGATALPAGGMLKAAGAAKAAVDIGAKGLIKEQILAPIARTPGKATIGETVAAMGAGAGAGIAREISPNNTTAETFGQLAGGIAPTALAGSPSSLAFRLGRKLTSRFSSKAQTAAAQDAINKVMSGAMSEESLKNIAKSERLRKKAPGLEPSTAEASGSPALLAQQRAIESEAQGKFLEEIIAKRRTNKQAISRFTNNAAPDADVNPGLVVHSANERMEVVGETIDRLVSKNIQSQKKLVGKVPEIDKMETGQLIRDGVDRARTDASLKMSIRAEELGINDADLTIPFNEWRKKVTKKYKLVSRFQDKSDYPKILRKIIADKPKKKKTVAGFIYAPTKAGETKPTTFVDIKAIREKITDEMIKALSPVNKDRPKIRMLTRLKKDVDGLVNSLDEQLGKNYAQFRKEYLDNFIKPFEQGAVFKIRRKDGTGFYRTSDESIAGEFLKNQSSAKQFREVFGKDASMMKAIHDSALDSLVGKVTVDGLIDSKKLTAWKAKNKDVLKEFPHISKSINKLEDAQNILWDRQAQLAGRQKYIEDNALVKILTRYKKGSIAADKVLTSAMTDERLMGDLVDLVNTDRKAIGSLKRVVWENITQGSSEDILTSINNNRKPLKKLFGPVHLKNIEDVSAMKAMMERLPAPKGKAHTEMPLKGFEDITGMAVPQAATRYWAFMSGRVPKYYLAFDIIKSSLYKKAQRHFDMLMREALYDPKVAKEMAESIRFGSFPEKKAKRLGARLFSLGVPYTREDRESKPSPELSAL